MATKMDIQAYVLFVVVLRLMSLLQNPGSVIVAFKDFLYRVIRQSGMTEDNWIDVSAFSIIHIGKE